MSIGASSANLISNWIGARVTATGVNYRVWAPDQTKMSVVRQRDGVSTSIPLSPENHGYWFGCDVGGRAGDLYRFRFADDRLLPDVASRFQPQGVHGPSECIDSSTYRWRNTSWVRPVWSGQTIYEVHVGTLTTAGTYRAAIETLDRVRELGAEVIEVMPLADFVGERNWGYDGVALYAPARCYGRPDDLREWVDAAHERGLAVILDVVYNHLGPAGNYLAEYSANYFHATETTPWGRALNFDGKGSRPVRDFIIGNAAYWLDEFRFDGLRLDATHAIFDRSAPHLLKEIADAVHARGGFLIAEDERNQAEILSSASGDGIGLDAVWSDDFHHQVRVALTGTQVSYYAGYSGTTDDLSSTLTHGWTYRGQPYAPWAGRHRGSVCEHLPTSAFVVCIENHDQVGNRPNGERLEQLVTPRQFRAASMLLCLGPYAPLIFMGQEWAATTPFLFFTDHGGELGRLISAGRRREFEQHGASDADEVIPDPEAPASFLDSKLHWSERDEPAHAAIWHLYRDCLEQRRAFLNHAALRRDFWRIHKIGEFLAIRYQLEGGERLLVVGLRAGPLAVSPLPTELQPLAGYVWKIVIHSEDLRYGGTEALSVKDGFNFNGPVAVWLAAVKEEVSHAAP